MNHEVNTFNQKFFSPFLVNEIEDNKDQNKDISLLLEIEKMDEKLMGLEERAMKSLSLYEVYKKLFRYLYRRIEQIKNDYAEMDYLVSFEAQEVRENLLFKLKAIEKNIEIIDEFIGDKDTVICA